MSSPNYTPVKVFHLISSLGRGGRERQVSIIYKYTDKKRFPTKIIYFNDMERNYIQEYNLSIDLIRIKEHGFISRLFCLLKLIKEEKPAIIFTWGINESALGLMIHVFTKTTFINGSIRHGIRLNRKSQLFRTLILKISPNIVANSYAGLKVNGIRNGYVLYNGVDIKFKKEHDPFENKHRKKSLLGIEDKKIILLSVANLVPYKDYFTVLRSLKTIKESGRDFKYVIIGDGPMKDQILQMIREFDLTSYVSLAGRVDNVNDYLQVANIFLHSSRGEGCSNAILEAMFSGLPVIASDTGGTTEIVKDYFGFLFPYKDHDSLSGKIIALMDNPDLRKTMAEKAFEYSNDNFLPEKMIENYYKIITNIMVNQ